MKINVRSTMHLAKILRGGNIHIEIGEPATLGGLLRELSNKYGQEFYDAVCNEGGYPSDKVAIMINGVSAVVKQGIDATISEDDDVLIIPVISGG